MVPIVKSSQTLNENFFKRYQKVPVPVLILVWNWIRIPHVDPDLDPRGKKRIADPDLKHCSACRGPASKLCKMKTTSSHLYNLVADGDESGPVGGAAVHHAGDQDPSRTLLGLPTTNNRHTVNI